ncbi:MAG: histidinol-phosphate transaminase [Candidatus Verstraetearchaeota archaeon]|jgi:histidinol-phosphate aminotransferase|nr:histidinol-phosphate transaminase [Candidatus Verstraetearchaeota archaeon]
MKIEINEEIKDLLSKKSFYEYIPDSIIRMGLNENLLIDKYFSYVLLMEAIKNIDIRLYPPAKGYSALKAISEEYGLYEDEVIVGNGSDEIIDLIAKVFVRKNEAIIIEPTFEMYSFYVKLIGGKIKSVLTNEDFDINVDEILSQVSKNTKVIFICSPNNPTGKQYEKEKILKIVKEFQGIVVLDEAYADFASYSIFMEAPKYDNLIVLRSFSKSHGLAGLRIGYGVGNSEIIRYLKSVQSPYSVNSIAQEVCKFVLRNKHVYDHFINLVKNEREYLIAELSTIKEIKVFPSSANFILIKLLTCSSSYICEKLREKGILVRDRGNLPLLENCIRVTVGRREDNIKFINTLRKVLEEK